MGLFYSNLKFRPITDPPVQPNRILCPPGIHPGEYGVLECCTVLYCTYPYCIVVLIPTPLPGGSKVSSTWRGRSTESGGVRGLDQVGWGRSSSDWGDRVGIWRQYEHQGGDENFVPIDEILLRYGFVKVARGRGPLGFYDIHGGVFFILPLISGVG